MKENGLISRLKKYKATTNSNHGYPVAPNLLEKDFKAERPNQKWVGDIGLTLEDLSAISGVSKSMLGEIERSSTNPTILVLWKIAAGLKIPLTRLIKEELDYSIVRNYELKVIDKEAEYCIYSVFPYYDLHKSEILKLEIAPHSKLSNSRHMNGVDEYIFVVKGNVKLILDSEEFVLHEGDSIRFKGELPHEFINCYDSTVNLINVLNYK
ncbi:cupin domain-containing protein [Thermanaerosceptrum fracticalcis]|uniref:Cupin domain-containing protein n=1 Tax=Thermanaerosceptrum fracticalcis TaxID=1712410 RepID=A0A7G6E6Y9_THEFR|nr:cupin domain-containing protein [Thermanaerosceptrum fracticalcis]QNB47843.1 cupin domain-containing protein [Thermanaerosceptrum fracticalcis]